MHFYNRAYRAQAVSHRYPEESIRLLACPGYLWYDINTLKKEVCLMPYEFESEFNIPSHEAFEAGFTGAFFALFTVFAIFYLALLAVGVLSYIFQSIGLYTIAKRRGILSPWLAWLPIGNIWIMGSISDQYQYVAKGRVKNRRKVLMGLTIAMLVFCVFMPIFAIIIAAAAASSGGVAALTAIVILVILYLSLIVAAIIAAVFQYIALYDIYNSCDPNNGAIYLVLSILFGITQPFFLFACRKKDCGMPPRKETKVEVLAPAVSAPEEPAEETPVQETPVQETETTPEETTEE